MKSRLVESIVSNINETENKVLHEGVEWSYFNKFDKYDEPYLPPQGEGETLATQAVTASTKLVYKWYNDGDVYDNNYYLDGWANDLSSYANWLAKYIDGAKDILDRIYDAKNDSDYEEILKDLCDMIYDDDYLAKLNEQPKEGSIYDCDGDYSFNERKYDEDEEEEW